MTVSDLFKQLVDIISDGQGDLPVYFGTSAVNSIVQKSSVPTPNNPDWEVWIELSSEYEF